MRTSGGARVVKLPARSRLSHSFCRAEPLVAASCWASDAAGMADTELAGDSSASSCGRLACAAGQQTASSLPTDVGPASSSSAACLAASHSRLLGAVSRMSCCWATWLTRGKHWRPGAVSEPGGSAAGAAVVTAVWGSAGAVSRSELPRASTLTAAASEDVADSSSLCGWASSYNME